MVLKNTFYLCFVMGKAIGWGGGHSQNKGGLVEFILPHHRPLILGVPHTRAEPCTKCIFVCVHGMKEKIVEQKIDGQNHHTGHKKGRPKKGLKMTNPQEFF
jgi:hypothetical protein